MAAWTGPFIPVFIDPITGGGDGESALGLVGMLHAGVGAGVGIIFRIGTTLGMTLGVPPGVGVEEAGTDGVTVVGTVGVTVVGTDGAEAGTTSDGAEAGTDGAATPTFGFIVVPRPGQDRVGIA